MFREARAAIILRFGRGVIEEVRQQLLQIRETEVRTVDEDADVRASDHLPRGIECVEAGGVVRKDRDTETRHYRARK